jgi:hypothetical protein
MARHNGPTNPESRRPEKTNCQRLFPSLTKERVMLSTRETGLVRAVDEILAN